MNDNSSPSINEVHKRKLVIDESEFQDDAVGLMFKQAGWCQAHKAVSIIYYCSS